LKEITKTLFYSAITIFIALSLIKYPDQSLEASIRGLNMWWEVVFPSLLPFFIIAELLIAFGVVNFLGVLFEPIMRPLFNVPGVGSFGYMLGMASGYPTGAKIAARLREEKQITQIEAERLVSFTNNASPLFIFGAISAGFFHDAKLGVLLAASHYIGNTIVGILMGFYGRGERKHKQKQPKQKVSLKRAFKEMHEARTGDVRPLGEIIADAVINSIKTLILIGGFIVLFSVIIKLLFLMDISDFIALFIQPILVLVGLPADFALPLFSGLFEITIGANMLSQVNMEQILPTAILISFILGFNGFSVHAQVASVLAKTDIRFIPYVVSRFLHGIIASILCVFLFKPLYLDQQTAQIDEQAVAAQATNSSWHTALESLSQIGPFITFFALGITAILMIKRYIH